MQVFRNYPFLSVLLVLLLVLKFILVPVIEWQNDSVWNVQQKQKHLNRATEARQNISGNQSELNNLRQQLTQLQSYFYPQQSEASFKLAQQQILESLFADNNLKVDNIGWTYSAQMLGQPLIKHQLSVSLQGKTADLPALYLALDNGPQWIDVLSFSFNMLGQQAQSLGTFRGSVDLVFYQLKDNQTESQQGQVNE